MPDINPNKEIPEELYPMDSSNETDMNISQKDLYAYSYRKELFSGKGLDVRDFHKLMPKHRFLKFNEDADTDRSLNKIMDE